MIRPIASSAALLARRWDQWWFRPVPPHALALVRMAFGAFLLFTWALKAPYVPLLFSSQGLVTPLLDEGLPERLIGLLAAPPPAAAWAVYIALLLSLLLLTLGAYTRTAALLALLLSLYGYHLSFFLFGASFDRLFTFTLAILALGGSDRAFSYTMWRRHGSLLAWEPTSILPQRLLTVQITATYLGVGWLKVVTPAWGSGEILSYSFAGSWGTSLARWLLKRNWPIAVYDAAVWLVRTFELALPIGLWVPRLQGWFFLGAALFHVAIALTLGIWWFLFLIPCYVLFLPPEQVTATLERWFHQRGFTLRRTGISTRSRGGER